MDRRAAKSALLIRLGGREIDYRFVRRRRRTLGISVDADGLRVSAPLRAPWRDIEGFVRAKERWILAKLDEWARAPRPAVVRGVSGERVPLFGRMVELQVENTSVKREGDTIVFDSIESLVKWLKATALEVLRPRAAHFAAMLGRPAPQVRLYPDWRTARERLELAGAALPILEATK